VIYVYRCLNMGNRDIKFKSKANQELMVCFWYRSKSGYLS
jgi:hypothetical protein